MIAILHTWGQNLSLHPHVHCIVPGGGMKMYELAPDAASAYACDGVFWLFLAYCAGVGGSILIIGSAAGVVVMGLEKVTFGWYLQKISALALTGYLAGAGWFVLQELVIRPAIGF